MILLIKDTSTIILIYPISIQIYKTLQKTISLLPAIVWECQQVRCAGENVRHVQDVGQRGWRARGDTDPAWSAWRWIYSPLRSRQLIWPPPSAWRRICPLLCSRRRIRPHSRGGIDRDGGGG